MRPIGAASKLAVTGLAVAALIAATPARAQASSSDKAAAEALFDRGVALLRAHDYAAACPKLEASQRIEPAIGTLLYLGECYERLGRTASAWATFREASSLARTAGETERAKLASQRAERLEPELAYLELQVSLEGRPANLVVKRGGDPIQPETYGVPIPVDPGEITVEASAPGHTSFSARLTIATKDRRTIVIPALVALPMSATAKDPTVAVPADPNESQTVAEAWRPTPKAAPSAGKGRFVAYVLGGVGLAGIGAGSYFGARAMFKNSDAKNRYGCEGSTCRERPGLELTSEAQQAARYSNVAFALGGGALAAGVVVFVLSAPERGSAIVVAPSVAENGAGLSVASRF